MVKEPPLIGPLNVVNGRIQLQNLPSTADPEWKYLRIYRNSATNSSDFRFVAELMEVVNNAPNRL